MSVCIGIDPDLHKTAVALVHREVKTSPINVLSLEVCEAPPQYKNKAAALASVLLMDPAMTRSALHGHFYRKEITDAEAWNYGIVAEMPDVTYSSKTGKKPQDMVHLAGVSGAALREFALLTDGEKKSAYWPLPREWKKGAPKVIHQGRVLEKLGGPWADFTRIGSAKRTDKENYCFPNNPPDPFKGFNQGEWKHLLDAIGLAIYGLDKMQGVI